MLDGYRILKLDFVSKIIHVDISVHLKKENVSQQSICYVNN